MVEYNKNNLRVTIEYLGKRIKKINFKKIRYITKALGVPKEDVKEILYDNFKIIGISFNLETALPREDILKFLVNYLSILQDEKKIEQKENYKSGKIFSSKIGVYVVGVYEN